MTDQTMELPTQPDTPDAKTRLEALDPSRSFIVQAPAGSGKTSLLTQRFLRLLATVEEPEEVVAITFTRKAAGEMRGRITEALRAADGPEPGKPHEQVTWRLARAARETDLKRGWDLINHPSRLRILTFDSYCAGLTRQMPLLAKFGAQPTIADDAKALHREAARRPLALLNQSSRHPEEARALRLLLDHLDNDFPRLEEVLIKHLASREQWLPHLMAVRGAEGESRCALEEALARVVADDLAALRAALPADEQGPLMELAAFAGANVAELDAGRPLASLAGREELPSTTATDLQAWQGLAEMLLKKDGGWRNRFDRNVGFPAKVDAPRGEKERYQAMKDGAAARVGTLAESGEALRTKLEAVRNLPPAAYDDAQWSVLEALTQVLPTAAAQLAVVFGETGQIDFTGVALGAQQALGQDEAPTDLAQILDYRVQHLLVDEFQDTSTVQMELLKRLTAGWAVGDGRTIFLVGDPMQSIYGFRDARVGLFLDARTHGLPGIQLESLWLTANFRSQKSVVDWVNEAFPAILPAGEDSTLAAVPYVACQPVRADDTESGVRIHPNLAGDPVAEAEEVVALARAAGAGETGASVAVLVRNRSHLTAITPRLREAGLPVEAVEIDRLGDRPLIQDLLALARALAHPGDRTAWLTVLRAPWAGLTLWDLHAIAGAAPNLAVPERLADPAVWEDLSPEGATRARRVWEVLEGTMADRQRGSLARRVEGVWRALEGPACIDRPEGLTEARTFFTELARVEAGGTVADLDALAERIQGLAAEPDRVGEGAVQLLTIHKAKGLEFNTVIVPGLHRPQPPETEKPLVRYLERPRGEGGVVDLLLAPVHATGAEKDPIYGYIERTIQTQRDHEDGRLLYVAATRACHRLHLLGAVPWKTNKETGEPELTEPSKNCLLNHLWPAVGGDFHQFFSRHGAEAFPEESPNSDRGVETPSTLGRLPRDWTRPDSPGSLGVDGERGPGNEGEEILLPEVPAPFRAGAAARHAGTVIHRLLRVIACQGPAAWSSEAVEARRSWIAEELTDLGVPDGALEETTERVIEAVKGALEDDTGRWVLDPAHAEAACEVPISGIADGDEENAVVDRTFVDETGQRWIVDYKSGTHQGGDLEAFLAEQETLHRDQLGRYAVLYKGLDGRPVRTALYFPLLGKLREVDVTAT